MKGKIKIKNNKLYYIGGLVYMRLKVRYILFVIYICGNIFFYVFNFVEGYLKFFVIFWYLMLKER